MKGTIEGKKTDSKYPVYFQPVDAYVCKLLVVIIDNRRFTFKWFSFNPLAGAVSKRKPKVYIYPLHTFHTKSK